MTRYIVGALNVTSNMNATENRYTLYGSELSYYTGKVRAYLDWKNLNYEEVSGTLEVFKNILLPNVGRGIIPVLQTPDNEFIQDSQAIINFLERTHPEPAMGPQGAVQKFASLLIELFADEWMIIPGLHYRWNYNEDWTYQNFGKTSLPEATPEEQYRFGKSRGQFFRNWMPEVGISGATIPGIEENYEAFLAQFTRHLQVHPFVFGNRPSHADFSLYGPLYAHLYRDPHSGELMKQRAPAVSAWVERCRDIRTENADGALIPNDEVPKTLLPILSTQMQEQLPVLLETQKLLEHWAKTMPSGTELPRGFETIACSIGGYEGTCLARSFPLWRLQAAMDQYQNLNAEKKAEADSMLESVGGAALKELRPRYRLARRGTELVANSVNA